MNYEIIFYHSGRTAEAERLLGSRLSRLGLERLSSAAATEPDDLPPMLSASLGRCGLVFIIGGLDGSKSSTEALLSQVLSSAAGDISSERLIDEDENIAYLISSGRQMIILLPDDTAVTDRMLEKRIISQLETFYSLSTREDDRPPIGQITKELDRQLASMPRKPVGFAVSAAAADYGRSERRMTLIAAILAAAAVIQAVTAVILLTAG